MIFHRLAIRFVLYTVMIAVVTSSLPIWAHEWGTRSFFVERGPVEYLQLCLLAITTLVFIASARKAPQWRELGLVLASVTALAATRELDFISNHLIPVLGWKVGFLFVLSAGWIAFSRRVVFRRQVHAFTSTRSFVILWAGFIVTLPLAQMLGHGTLFEAMMGEDYQRHYKRVIEESCELIGYVILMSGSIEWRCETRVGPPADLE
ncbi:MAG TPA: hypothetical protein PKE12_00815 [Kiritimatiellia bacterium]|nr:hypothetical protein [Kiritimatiellia bacterium]